MKNEYRFKSNIDYCDFFSKGKLPEISYKRWPIVFFNIVALFSDDCEYNIKECYIHKNRLIIRGRYRDDTCELLLRFPVEDKKLIVARVAFIHKRQGNMTKLYALLKRIQKKYKLGSIIVESAQTEAMHCWCRKTGFVEDKITKTVSTYREPEKLRNGKNISIGIGKK